MKFSEVQSLHRKSPQQPAGKDASETSEEECPSNYQTLLDTMCSHMLAGGILKVEEIGVENLYTSANKLLQERENHIMDLNGWNLMKTTGYSIFTKFADYLREDLLHQYTQNSC